MPQVDHTVIVMEAWDESNLPPPLRTVESILPFTNLILSKIPTNEKPGYVKSPPGGSNSITLPDGTLVRVGRIMYSDGYMYKCMGDIPNGKPQWVLEETGENKQLYHPYSGSFDGGPGLPIDEDLRTEVNKLYGELKLLYDRYKELKDTIETNRKRMEAINERFDKESKEQNVHLSDKFVGKAPLFGGTVESILKSRE